MFGNLDLSSHSQILLTAVLVSTNKKHVCLFVLFSYTCEFDREPVEEIKQFCMC